MRDVTSADPDGAPPGDPLVVGPGLTPAELHARQELTDALHRELLAIRKMSGRLTPQKFARFPTLVHVCGGDDLRDGYAMFLRELSAVQRRGRNLAAAALSITSEAESVLDRLQQTADTLSEPDEWRDQRTARRWADAGMPVLASHLAEQAVTQGRLGRELLNIAVEHSASGVTFTIDHITHTELPTPKVFAQLWIEANGERLPFDEGLANTTWGRSQSDTYVMNRATIEVGIDAVEVATKNGGALVLTAAGADAPARHTVVSYHSTGGGDPQLTMSTYRTVTMVEIRNL